MAYDTHIIKTIGRGALALLLASFLIAACSAAPQEPAIPDGAGFSSWFDNGAHGHYVLEVIEGKIPPMLESDTAARVMTDSNCAPDAAGLNHCHNIIRFEDGREITLVNNHQMSVHRCLRPGETVHVSVLAPGWITLQIG